MKKLAVLIIILLSVVIVYAEKNQKTDIEVYAKIEGNSANNGMQKTGATESGNAKQPAQETPQTDIIEDDIPQMPAVNESPRARYEKQKEIARTETNRIADDEKRKVYENQNEVRAAVHAFLAMENMTGIGKNVSAIAKEFDNSIMSTIRAEERINNRSRIKRFFAGGDEEAAKEIEAETEMNKERIEEIKKLKEQASEDEKEVMNEQITEMEKEQTRLKELAQKEKKSKGLFGWIWK